MFEILSQALFPATMKEQRLIYSLTNREKRQVLRNNGLQTPTAGSTGHGGEACNGPTSLPGAPRRHTEKGSLLKMKPSPRSGAPASASSCAAEDRRERQRLRGTPERPAEGRSELRHAPIPRPGRSRWRGADGLSHVEPDWEQLLSHRSRPSPQRGRDSVQGLN